MMHVMMHAATAASVHSVAARRAADIAVASSGRSCSNQGKKGIASRSQGCKRAGNVGRTRLTSEGRYSEWYYYEKGS